MHLRPALAAALLLPLACGRPHDLGVGGSSTTTASGGGGSSTATTASGGAGGVGGATTSTTSTSTTTTVPEPPGETALTVVHGITDYPAVRFCFLPGDTPWPSAASGLPFGRAQAVQPLPGGEVTPWVIAGDLAQTAGKTCAQILALAGADGGSPVVARALGVVPASVWGSKRSLLLVAQGCLGGPGHDDPGAKSACGASYSSTSPTAGAVLVTMSRIADPAHVSLQVVSATPAVTQDLDVRAQPGITEAAPVAVVSGLTPGGIGPKPPFAQLTLAEYGPLDAAQIQTTQPGSPTPTSTLPLAGLLSANGLAAADFADGARLVLVGVGAAPGSPAAQFWRAFTWVMVKEP